MSENAIDTSTLLDALETGNSADILNAIKDVAGEDAVKDILSAARSSSRNAKTAEKQKYLNDRTAAIIDLQGKVELLVAEMFTDLQEDETIRLDLTAVVDHNGQAGVMTKTRHSAVKQPVVFAANGNPSTMDEFRGFGKRTYTRKSEDAE